jgi:hypothetical protein
MHIPTYVLYEVHIYILVSPEFLHFTRSNFISKIRINNINLNYILLFTYISH